MLDDINLTPEELDAKYNPDGDGEHPMFRRADWRHEVRSEKTLRGYWEWVEAQIWQHAFDEE